MGLFEVLLVVFFIVIPVIEGIMKERRKRQGGGLPGPEGRPGTPRSSSSEQETGDPPRSAAEMLPEDLWQLMTGEKDASKTADAGRSGGAPWSTEPDVPGDNTIAVEDDWVSEPWETDDEATAAEPVSAEYTGPEAYSLETPAPLPMERTVPTAEARHRKFHEFIDRPEGVRPRRQTPLIRALRNPDGLRQAVLMREILGPPKGME